MTWTSSVNFHLQLHAFPPWTSFACKGPVDDAPKQNNDFHISRNNNEASHTMKHHNNFFFFFFVRGMNFIISKASPNTKLLVQEEGIPPAKQSHQLTLQQTSPSNEPLHWLYGLPTQLTQHVGLCTNTIYPHTNAPDVTRQAVNIKQSLL